MMVESTSREPDDMVKWTKIKIEPLQLLFFFTCVVSRHWIDILIEHKFISIKLKQEE